MATLSRTFEEEGWRTGPPIDIVYTKAFNLLDPGFFMVVLGLILEGWVSVLHLGSSFSVAFNRRASKRISADERPVVRDNCTRRFSSYMPLVPEVAAPGILCRPHATLWCEKLPGELCTCAGQLVPCHGKPGRHGDEPLRGRHAGGGKGVNNPLGLLSVERCGGTCRLGHARQESSTANEFIADSWCPVRPLPDPPQPTPDPRHRSTCQETPVRVWLDSCAGILDAQDVQCHVHSTAGSTKVADMASTRS